MVEPVRKAIEVGCDPATAFEIFTARIADWWPMETNSISAMQGTPARALVLEPGIGGQVYEITAEGKREDWARVTEFAPGRRLVLAWHVMAPEDRATEVAIDFVAIDGGTRVELVHAGWEILGEEAGARRDSYNDGWVNVFESRYAAACAA
ncbi:MAG: SRPBCC domain-containing protein [Pseudomonadota bacterium]|nr:SRPBCC domain-containing protein [Pseudomonadota bacterium]